MGVVIIPVKSTEIDKVKHLLTWHFDSFAERSRGETEAASLLADIGKADRQCWVAWDDEVRAVALTRVMDNPKHTVEMTHCAGNGRSDWQENMVRTIRAWAIERGSKTFRVVCRPGWVRLLKGEGLKETHRVMEQEL